MFGAGPAASFVDTRPPELRMMTGGPGEVVRVDPGGDAGPVAIGVVGDAAGVGVVTDGGVDAEEPVNGPVGAGLVAAPPFGDASPVAHATPGAVTAIPTPNAIASAPTRPMWRA